jgi:hypothetical protein
MCLCCRPSCLQPFSSSHFRLLISQQGFSLLPMSLYTYACIPSLPVSTQSRWVGHHSASTHWKDFLSAPSLSFTSKYGYWNPSFHPSSCDLSGGFSSFLQECSHNMAACTFFFFLLDRERGEREREREEREELPLTHHYTLANNGKASPAAFYHPSHTIHNRSHPSYLISASQVSHFSQSCPMQDAERPESEIQILSSHRAFNCFSLSLE